MTFRLVCPDSVVKTWRPLKAENPLVPGVQTWQIVQSSVARDNTCRLPRHFGFCQIFRTSGPERISVCVALWLARSFPSRFRESIPAVVTGQTPALVWILRSDETCSSQNETASGLLPPFGVAG